MIFDRRAAGRCIFIVLWLATLIVMDAVLATLLPPGIAPGGFVIGVGTHDPSVPALRLIHNAGIAFLRDDIRWNQVELTKNAYAMPGDYDHFVDEALRNGIEPLLILCYGNKLYDHGLYPTSPEAVEAFTRFAEFVIRHFKNRVRYYEVWNEWNVGTGVADNVFYGDPVQYVALLKKVYPRLRRADPKITVIGGVVSGNGIRNDWMQGACKSGLLDCLDAFSFHPYCYGAPDGERRPEVGLMKRIRRNYEIMRRYQKRDIPVYLTEIGWPTYYGPYRSSPRDEACFLARSYLMMRTLSFVKGMWWYDFSDDGLNPGDPESNFGIVTNNLAPKPAYFAMRDVCRLFAEAQYTGRLEANPNIRIMKFSRVSGEALWVVWSIDDTEGWEVTFSNISRNQWDFAPARTRLIGSIESERKWERKDGLSTISVRLSGMPMVIDTGNAEVEVSWHHAGRQGSPAQSNQGNH
jgi:hypothetical protein